MDNVHSIDHLWTVEDVARYLAVPVETIRAWRKRDFGPRARKLGKHLRYDPVEVRSWFSEAA
jgi:hypothetical protein